MATGVKLSTITNKVWNEELLERNKLHILYFADNIDPIMYDTAENGGNYVRFTAGCPNYQYILDNYCEIFNVCENNELLLLKNSTGVEIHW